MDTTTLENAARMAHEVNRAWCDLIGDRSQVAWHEAAEWQKASARAGVKFHLGAGNFDPRASHDSWMRMKLDEGWEYGPVKDELAKTHPCLMPFDQLPPEQQMKDRLFCAVVRTITEGETL